MARQHLNPHTVMRLAQAFQRIADSRPHGPAKGMPAHVLDIGYHARDPLTGKPMWSATVYRAAHLGYLSRTSMGMYRPTPRFWAEVERVEQLKARQSSTSPDSRPALRRVL